MTALSGLSKLWTAVFARTERLTTGHDGESRHPRQAHGNPLTGRSRRRQRRLRRTRAIFVKGSRRRG